MLKKQFIKEKLEEVLVEKGSGSNSIFMLLMLEPFWYVVIYLPCVPLIVSVDILSCGPCCCVSSSTITFPFSFATTIPMHSQ